MASRNYLIPIGSMTLSDQKSYRLAALASGLERCQVKSIGDLNSDIPGLASISDTGKRVQLIVNYLMQGNWPRSVDVREWQNIADAGAALDQWNTAALAVVGTNYSMFQAIAAPTLAPNKLAVFYGVITETIPVPVSRLTFRRGGAAGNTIGVFDLELLASRQELIGYFSEPVVIDPNSVFAAQAMARIATGVLARMQLMNFVFEPAGQIVA